MLHRTMLYIYIYIYIYISQIITAKEHRHVQHDGDPDDGRGAQLRLSKRFILASTSLYDVTLPLTLVG